MVSTYEQFVAYAGEIGILAFYGKFLPGFPRLEDVTETDKWMDNNQDINPWYWDVCCKG